MKFLEELKWVLSYNQPPEKRTWGVPKCPNPPPPPAARKSALSLIEIVQGSKTVNCRDTMRPEIPFVECKQKPRFRWVNKCGGWGWVATNQSAIKYVTEQIWHNPK